MFLGTDFSLSLKHATSPDNSVALRRKITNKGIRNNDYTTGVEGSLSAAKFHRVKTQYGIVLLFACSNSEARSCRKRSRI